MNRMGLFLYGFLLSGVFMVTIVKQRKGYYAHQHNSILKQVLTVSGGELSMYSFILVDVDGEFRRGAFVIECGDTFDWVQHGG